MRWLIALAALALPTPLALGLDFRLDTCTWGVDGFGQAQLDHLCWTSPNGHAIAMPGGDHRSTIESTGNTYFGYYNTLTGEWSSGKTATQAASDINSYVQTNSGTPTPTWVELNEISPSLWPNNASYRTWLRSVVSQLHNSYSYNVVLFSPFSAPGYNGADWRPLSQDCYIAVENYLSGQEMKDHGFSVTWAQQQYQVSVEKYAALGVDSSRLFLGENFSNTVAGTNWGRAGVSAADWRTAILARDDAIRNVGFAGFAGYGWSHNDMGASTSDLVSFEDAYRSHVVVESEGPEWITDSNGSWGTAANWIKAATLNINLPPNGMSEIANFVTPLSAPRTVTIDAPRTLGRITFDSANGYTLAPGAAGSLTFSNNGLNGSITVDNGSHTISAPVTLSDGIDAKINSGMLTLTGTLDNSAGKTINKSGAGALVIGPQSNGAGARINVTGGSLILNADAGSTSSAQLSVLVSSGSATFNSAQHLVSLNVTTTAAMSPGGTHPLYANTLALSASARLDLNDNDLVVNNGNFPTIQNLVSAGYRDHVDANATGIVSTTSQADGGITILKLLDNSLVSVTDWPVGSGNSIGPNAIIGKYTYLGDTNLDGAVSGADYNAVDGYLGQTVPAGLAVLYGDTNFDNQITGADYNFIDGELGLGVGSPLAVSGTSSVPEPASLGLLGVGALGTLARRRRR